MLKWIVSSSILIAAIIVSRYFLKGRVSRRLQYGLWLLAAMRLLIPVSPIQSPLGVGDLLLEIHTERDGENMVDLSDIALPVNVRLEEDSRQTSAAGEHTYGAADSNAQAVDAQGHCRAGRKNITGGEEESAHRAKLGIRAVAGYIWITGTCVLAFWLAAVNGVFRCKVRRSRRPVETPGKWGEKKMLPVYVTDQIGSPCMYGLFFPSVYITPSVAEDPRLFATVLCHEQTHYRQRDHIWSVIRSLCLCIHWYNPLVWAAVNLSRQDGELACDEGVLRRMGVENRGEYGEALLALSAGIRPAMPRAMSLATSMSATKRQLRERLSALTAVPRMAAGTAVSVILLFTAMALVAFTSNAYSGGDSPETDRTNGLGKARVGYDRTGSGRQMETPGEFPVDRENTEGQTLPLGTEELMNIEGQTLPLGTGEPMNMEGQMLPLGSEEPMNVERQTLPLELESIYDSWDAKILWYFDEDHRPVAEIWEGDTERKLTFVETSWSLSVQEQPYSREILYWACQALRELEQWTGTEIGEVCYSVSELGGYSFALTPEDLEHDRIFFDRYYNQLFGGTGVIEHIGYSTDMDVWFSPVKQYVTPPGYDKMTMEEILIWYFERSEAARGSKVEEIVWPWEGDCVLQTDQGTYYEYTVSDTIGRGMSLYGPYDHYPEH